MNQPRDLASSIIQQNYDTREFLVPRYAFTDPEVLTLERERIFSKCWIYAAHESEIPNPHDFVTRRIAGRKLIVVRDENMRVHAYYNTCTHRGALICREDKGNNKFFVCGYHGWTFNDQGQMVDEPGTSGYPDDFFSGDRKKLFEAPKLESYRDFVFVNFDENAVDLPTYLGEARDILDIVADQDPDGMEVVGGTQKYSMRANWKLLVENSADGYHAGPTHATYFDYLLSTPGSILKNFNIADMEGKVYDYGNGHVSVEGRGPWGRPVATWCERWGEEGKKEIEKIRQEIHNRVGPQRGRRITDLGRNMQIFPNLVINDIMALTIRTFDPIDTAYQHINAWALAPKNESEFMRNWRLYNFLDFLGPGGFATPDDVEMLELCQQGYEGMEEVDYNDISKGFGVAPENTQLDDEWQMRVFWRQWNKLMAA